MTAAVKTNSMIRTRPSPTCSICGSPGSQVYSGAKDKIFGVPGEWDFSRCSNIDCRLVWLDPRPLEEDIHQAYATYYTHASQKKNKSIAARILSATLRVLARSVVLVGGLKKQKQDVSDMHLNELQPGRLLDIGCGDGRFLHQMKSRGWSVVGLDFDVQAARAAKEKYDIDVKACRLEDMGCPENSFDAVTMHHVIEHVFDPIATMREIYRILKPGGMVVAVTPNAESQGLRIYGSNWRGLEPPRHIQIFSPQALESTARKAGFESVRVYSTAANAWMVLSASMQIAETTTKTSEPQRPSIRMLLKALAMNYREARMNARSLSVGEENVLRAQKG